MTRQRIHTNYLKNKYEEIKTYMYNKEIIVSLLRKSKKKTCFDNLKKNPRNRQHIFLENNKTVTL